VPIVSGDDPTAALVVRAQRGDAEAFESLVRAYLRVAYSVALAVVGRPTDAEDVAQDAFLRAFERIDTCREPERFAGWLLQIVRNQARNWLDRRRWRDVPAAEHTREQVAGEDSPETAAGRGQLLAALQFLGTAQREVLLLHDLEGWTHAEIAASVGISEVMSRQHLFRARRELRAKLGADASAEVDHE
jgi:RNA polymerase sigma-70 factor (ECF subfamily)